MKFVTKNDILLFSGKMTHRATSVDKKCMDGREFIDHQIVLIKKNRI